MFVVYLDHPTLAYFNIFFLMVAWKNLVFLSPSLFLLVCFFVGEKPQLGKMIFWISSLLLYSFRWYIVFMGSNKVWVICKFSLSSAVSFTRPLKWSELSFLRLFFRDFNPFTRFNILQPYIPSSLVSRTHFLKSGSSLQVLLYLNTLLLL